MAQLFKTAAEKIKKSNLVIPITLVFILMFITAIATSYEDYSTTLLGYNATPTLKANSWVVYFVALIPQTAMIGFSYMFLDDTRKKWAFWLTVICFGVDTYYDVYYKSQQFANMDLIINSLIESITIYTLGSEIMLTSSFAMLTQLFPEFLDKVYNLYSKTSTVIGKFTKNRITVTGAIKELGLIVEDEEETENKSKRGRPAKNELADLVRPIPQQTEKVVDKRIEELKRKGNNQQQNQKHQNQNKKPEQDLPEFIKRQQYER